MEKNLPFRTLSVWIARSVQEVYGFAAVPENFPRWASGLSQSLRKEHGEWLAETPTGPMKLRFTDRNDFGILDHYVIPETGSEIYVPMRVIANGTGSEVLFTLFRLPGMSDAKFEEDAAWVTRDLQALKKLMESRLH